MIKKEDIEKLDKETKLLIQILREGITDRRTHLFLQDTIKAMESLLHKLDVESKSVTLIKS